MPGNYTYSLFEGTGGLYRCYVTNAFALSRQLSVGINLGTVSYTHLTIGNASLLQGFFCLAHTGYFGIGIYHAGDGTVAQDVYKRQA